MKPSIRKAIASDYGDLCALVDQVDTLHRKSLPHIFQKPSGVVRGRDYVLGLIADESVGLFVAQVEGRLVGLICVMIRESPDIPIFVRRRYAVIESVVVAEEHRREGIGRGLVEKAHQWAAAEGADSIELNVWEFNQGGVQFYERLGYQTASRRMNKRLTSRSDL